MKPFLVPDFYKKTPEIAGILEHPDFLSMRGFRHHGNISCYFHTLRVTEIAYTLACRYEVDVFAVLRGALLHDFYLYDWHNGAPPFHGYRHPCCALREAESRFSLDEKERDCIKKHMFPLTPFPPVFRESWIVNFADKIAAAHDYSKIFLYDPVRKFCMGRT